MAETIIDACGRERPVSAYHSRHRRRPDRSVQCATDHRHGPCQMNWKRCDCACHEGEWIDPQGVLFDPIG